MGHAALRVDSVAAIYRTAVLVTALVDNVLPHLTQCRRMDPVAQLLTTGFVVTANGDHVALATGNAVETRLTARQGFAFLVPVRKKPRQREGQA